MYYHYDKATVVPVGREMRSITGGKEALMLRRILLVLVLLAVGAVTLAQVEAPPACQLCGMDRSTFARMPAIGPA
jgi:hypothetical protein